MVVGRVDGLEARRICQLPALGGGIIASKREGAYSLPRKSLKYAIVLEGFLTMKAFAWPP